MAIRKVNNNFSTEEIAHLEMIEKQKVINDLLYNAISSVKEAIQCISNMSAVATETETKSSINRIVDEISIHLDEVKRNIQDFDK
ncbi:MAG: hypothetical protein ACM3MI_04485 [Clostridiales bacterium]